MSLTFREAHEGDLDELLDVRASTRENAIARAQLARMGITVASMSESMARGTLKGWVCFGKTLLSLVVEWLYSFNPARVWLGASPNPDTRAYGFYRALGWRPTGETDARGDEILVLTTRPH